MKHIAVFFGGESVEHDVSVITGVLTANSLDKDKFIPVPVYVDRHGEWFTGEYLLDTDNYKDFDSRRVTKVALLPGGNALMLVKKRRLKPLCNVYAAVNCMHGERGEDGSLAGLCNMCGVPLVSPPLFASAASMDKVFTKTVLKGLGVRCLPYRAADSVKKAAEGARFPCVVKPACGGSSIGVRRAENERELSEAAAYALRFGKTAVIEPCLTGFTEINCAAYRGEKGIRVSECERPVGRGEVLSFKDKYQTGTREFPANIPSELSEKIKSITEKVYEKMGFSGIVRADYFISGGKVYLNEINAVPGSLAYYLFTDTLAGFKDILTELIGVCVKEFSESGTLQRNYDSGILRAIGGKSAKRL